MKKYNLFRLISLLVFSSFLSLAQAFTEVANKEELRQRLAALTPSENLSDIKIAVLDNSFGSFVPGKGMLPDSAELIEGPIKYPSTGSHGLGMAQILWAITGQKANGPKIYLINTNGFTNFKSAIDFVIENKVDIVLYSQIWLFGSNFDGKGFINAEVNRATDKGVIWINAAGNLGGHVYSGDVNAATKQFKLKNKLDENSFTVTLAWNNFSDSVLTCATKDLDLEIVDKANKVIQSSQLIQRGQAPDLKDPNDQRSCYARESISVKSLNRGDYQIRVVSKSANLGLKDSFKVIITDDRPNSLDFTDHSVGFEIMPPADNASVITVGDQSALSSVGPTADGRIKPDFVIKDSKVSFTNGNLTQGSSNAAAMVAGSIAILKSLKSDLNSKQLLAFAESLRIQYLIPAGLINPTFVPQWMQKYVPAGGIVRSHPATGRAVILSKEAPLELPLIRRFNLRLIAPSDLIACNEYLNSCGVYPRSQDPYLAPPLIEFRSLNKGEIGGIPGVWNNPEL